MYSFAQLEAFTAVAEHGSLMKAASKLGKDRTTLRDLIDFLEDGLGYALFVREGRHLQLTPEGEQLQRQAHLLMRQVRAFEAFARAVPDSAMQDISLVYDPFTPRAFLQALLAKMATRNVRLSLTCASRDDAEAMLARGAADLGICQARNRSVGNELEMLRGLLEKGCGWGFLPTHLQAARWQNVKRLHTEVGSQGIGQTMVTIWKPGSDKRGLINETLSLLPSLWKDSAL